ncbi:MAG TPA: sigma-70 family RNA polymerase sigma factor [Pirellulaceae bacterium]
MDRGFTEFLKRIREGDESAAEDLVRRYEPLIRREVRSHLEDSPLVRSLDSIDISQSVLASFFVRVAAGEYDLHEPSQLIRLLVKMARNKLASQARRQFSQKRDARRVDAGTGLFGRVADPAESPSQNISGQELFESFCAKLTADERRISQLRSQDLSWEEIAGQLGGTPHGRRMQLTRAVDRISLELGLDE